MVIELASSRLTVMCHLQWVRYHLTMGKMLSVTSIEKGGGWGGPGIAEDAYGSGALQDNSLTVLSAGLQSQAALHLQWLLAQHHLLSTQDAFCHPYPDLCKLKATEVALPCRLHLFTHDVIVQASWSISVSVCFHPYKIGFLMAFISALPLYTSMSQRVAASQS
jgi:hypothetical protein